MSRPSRCIGSSVLSLSQGANSASTANVTRIRIDSKFENTGLKTGHYKTLSSGVGHALGAALGDVAVGFIPAHRTLERCCHRPRLKSQFTLGARAVHKHH